ncbi:trypsin-like peptidase domain-containing protein [Streptomyces sp. RPT161]|uniref:trypsin-like peptidase domain-containing protein n=1 Tax=Streptomyces sp. RPT161 TaxID=3015993 RepID=UPI0022B893CF|nr:trypsin-like peptidase domain-containing protein [Streptomyces sp. RPT161]
MLNEKRVVEIYEPQTGSVGSGYLINEYAVLTARHVVEGALRDDGPLAPPPLENLGEGLEGLVRDHPHCRIRQLHRGGQATFDDAIVAWWSPQFDVALLIVTDITKSRTQHGRDFDDFDIMWADVTGTNPVEVTAVGFPDSDVDGRVRESRQIKGFVTPLSGVKSDRWVIQIEGGARLARPGGSSVWAGMSGAALFADGLFIGIIESDKTPGHPEGRELWALPARAFADDPHLMAWARLRARAWHRSPADPGDTQRMLRQVVDANQRLPVLDDVSTSKIARALAALQHARDDRMVTRRAVGRVLAMMLSKGALHDDLHFEVWRAVFGSLRELRTALTEAYTELVVTGPEPVRAAIDAMLTTVRGYLGRHEASFDRHAAETTGTWMQVQDSWPGLPRASLELLAVRETLDALVYPLNQYVDNSEVDASRFTPPHSNRQSVSSSYLRCPVGDAASRTPMVSMAVLATALESEPRSLRMAALEELAQRAERGNVPAARVLLDLMSHQDDVVRTRAKTMLPRLPSEAAERSHIPLLIAAYDDPMDWAHEFDRDKDLDPGWLPSDWSREGWQTQVCVAALQLLTPWKAEPGVSAVFARAANDPLLTRWRAEPGV